MGKVSFSDDFKRDAVAQIIEQGYPVAEVPQPGLFFRNVARGSGRHGRPIGFRSTRWFRGSSSGP